MRYVRTHTSPSYLLPHSLITLYKATVALPSSQSYVKRFAATNLIRLLLLRKTDMQAQ